MNWRILYKYVEGTCSEHELKQLGDWLKENPANEDFFKTFVEQTDQEQDYNLEVDARKAWNKFKEEYINEHNLKLKDLITKIDKPKRYMDSGKRSERKSKLYLFFMAAAAILLVTALFYAKFAVNHQENSKASTLAFRKISTTKGERISLELKDGTHIVLNSESELKIPKNYGIASRTIYLKGEAFFKVRFEKKHPFMVVVNHNFIEDLGTQFNVMAYDTSEVQVAVQEGLVSVGKIGQGTNKKELGKLTPNKLGIMKRNGKFEVSNISDIDRYMGWTEGKLVFWKAPFSKVVEKLQRWYGVSCIVSNPGLEKRTLTATYDNMSEDEVLKIISLTMNITYSRHNNTIIFRNK